MLSSDHDGEALGPARALPRTLQSAGCTFHDLANRIESNGKIPEADMRKLY
jgi:hypothetical protein